PAARELAHPRTPLRGTLIVTHALAREDLPAAYDTDRVELLHLSGRGGEGCFVEAAHAALDVAGADACETFESERGELDALIADVAREGAGHLRAIDRRRRI